MSFFKKKIKLSHSSNYLHPEQIWQKDDIFTRKFFGKSFFKIGISSIEHAKFPVTIYDPKKKILLLSATKKTQQV